MGIGEIIVLIEDHIFLSTPYKKGQRFKIIGSDNIRGLDIESLDTGEKIYETRFSGSSYVSLKKFREDKLKKLGIDEDNCSKKNDTE
jgi:hypothetical protein